MTSNFLTKTLVITGLCAVFAVTFFLTDDNKQSARILGESLQLEEEQVPITGRVTRLGESEFYIQFEYYQQEAEGNKLISVEKKVIFDSGTQIFMSQSMTLAQFTDIQPQALVTVYIPVSLFEEQEVVAQRIVIE